MKRSTLIVVVFINIAAFGIGFYVVNTLDGDGAPEFGKGTVGEIEQAVNRAGLDLADGETGDADITGGYENTTYTVSTQTKATDGLMVVRAFSGPEQLDAINEDSYVGDSALGYRWQQYTVSVTASTPPEVIDLFRDAMDELGAKVIYDHL